VSAVSISELMRAAGSASGKRVLVVLRACIDASWGDQPPGVTVVAGYVAHLDEAERVEKEWIEGLQYWHIPYFHLSELSRMVAHPDLCELFFSNIIKQSRLAPVGSALLNIDWENPDWGGDITIRRSTPYEQCLDFAFRVIGDYIKERHPGERVSILCCLDSSENVIVDAFKRRKQHYGQFDDIVIKSSKEQPFMQCADLGAGLLRRSWRAIIRGDPDAQDLPWGAMPKGHGVQGRNSFWSLRQGAMLARALKIYEERER
jgi:Protein of unknown function (DUF3800)